MYAHTLTRHVINPPLPLDDVPTVKLFALCNSIMHLLSYMFITICGGGMLSIDYIPPPPLHITLAFLQMCCVVAARLAILQLFGRCRVATHCELTDNDDVMLT